MTIKIMEKKDIDTVMDIWLETNIATHSYIDSAYWTGHREDVKNAMEQAEVYVYKQNEVLGFIGMEGNYIAGIFISKGNQSKGIGKQLLDYAKDIKSELSLTVYEKNNSAVAFYQREKFVIQSENIDQNTGEKEYLMLWKCENKNVES